MTRSYAIAQDTRGILWNLNQFWKRSYSIIDKIIYKCLFEQVNAKRSFNKDHMESLSTLENILRDDRLDPMQSKKILEEFYRILIRSGKDPAVL